jgi:hypothetical protein
MLESPPTSPGPIVRSKRSRKCALHAGTGGGGYIVLVGGDVEWVDGPAFLARIDAITLPDGTPYAPHRDDN